jgi:hypothetical protein
MKVTYVHRRWEGRREKEERKRRRDELQLPGSSRLKVTAQNR